jgi:hypothetical protein
MEQSSSESQVRVSLDAQLVERSTPSSQSGSIQSGVSSERVILTALALLYRDHRIGLVVFLCCCEGGHHLSARARRELWNSIGR